MTIAQRILIFLKISLRVPKYTSANPAIMSCLHIGISRFPVRPEYFLYIILYFYVSLKPFTRTWRICLENIFKAKEKKEKKTTRLSPVSLAYK